MKIDIKTFISSNLRNLIKIHIHTTNLYAAVYGKKLKIWKIVVPEKLF